MLWRRPAACPAAAGTDATSLAVTCCAAPLLCRNGPPKRPDLTYFRSRSGNAYCRETALLRADGEMLELPWPG